MRAIALLLISAASLIAQSTPSAVDCRFTDTFTAATTGAARINDTVGTPCVAWRITVNTSGFSGFSIQFETSPDNTTFTAVPNSVCSSAVPPPCMIDGSNPDTTTGSSTFSLKAYGKFIRLNVTSVTGSGTINTNTLGYKGLSAQGGGASTGAGLADPGTNGFVVRTSFNVTTSDTLTAGTGITITNPTGVAGNPTFTLTGPFQPNTAATGANSAGIPATGWTQIGTPINFNDFSPGMMGLTLKNNGAQILSAVTRSLTVPYTLYTLGQCPVQQNITATYDCAILLSDGTKYEGFEFTWQNGQVLGLRVCTYNAFNTFNACGAISGNVGEMFAFKIQNNSTNRIFSYWNGGAWVAFLTEASGTFLTETQAGWGGWLGGSSLTSMQVKLLYWNVQ